MSSRSLLFASLVVSSLAAAQVTKPHPGLTLVRSGGSALVVADLCAAGVSVRATTYAERNARAVTWADRVGAHAAVNADFFDLGAWTWVIGRARGAGEEWPAGKQQREPRPYWQFGPNLAQMIESGVTAPAPGVTDIVGGHNVIIRNGQSLAPNFDGDSVITTSHRRTAIGLSADKQHLYLFASNNSYNGTQLVAALQSLASQAGAPPVDFATNMDGGGSSQLYVRGVGQVIDTTRPVNNHLGVFARGSGTSPQCPVKPELRDVVGRDTKSGWTLDARGTIAAFGGAPALGPARARWSFDVARRLTMRADGVSAYLLDGWGGVHAVGNAPDIADTSHAYWPNWDIARALGVRRDGMGGYILDGYGGIHPFGGAPAVQGIAGWPGTDIARDLLLRRDGTSGYVLDGKGGLTPFGGAPALRVTKSFTTDAAVRAVLSFDEQSGYVVDKAGALWPFGDAPSVKTDAFADQKVTSLSLAADGVSGMVLHGVDGPKAFRSARVVRAFAFKPGSRSEGYRLRGDGEVEAFGGAAPLDAPVMWPNWDIARDLAMRADGVSGWVLDGYGGVHGFGGAPTPPSGGPYWKDWDIVRRFVSVNDSLGYLLEGYGGLHPLLGSPDLPYTGYTPGSDISRDVAINRAGTGGFTLDGKGAVHPFGAYTEGATEPLWTWDIGRAIALRSDETSGYVLDGWGGVHEFGGAEAASHYDYAQGWDVYRDLAWFGEGEGASLDAYGNVHRISFPYDAGVPEEPVVTLPDGGTAPEMAPVDELRGGCGCTGSGGVPLVLALTLLVRRRPRHSS